MLFRRECFLRLVDTFFFLFPLLPFYSTPSFFLPPSFLFFSFLPISLLHLVSISLTRVSPLPSLSAMTWGMCFKKNQIKMTHKVQKNFSTPLLLDDRTLNFLAPLFLLSGNLDLTGQKQVFKAENNPWVTPIADQFQLGVSHVFEYIRSETYK